jgi:nucleoside-diphosphate-sugar epimerase
MKIVVIGGTGLIGSKTVGILRQGAHEVVAASPQSGVNSITGEGLIPSPVNHDSRGGFPDAVMI